MQRPLVRRRNTVFEKQDLSQLIGLPRSSSEGVETDVTVDHPRRPGLYRNHKTLSLYQPSFAERQSLQLAMENDVIDDVNESSHNAPISGSAAVSVNDADAPVLAAEKNSAELAVVMETIGADKISDDNDAQERSPVMSPAEEKVGGEEEMDDVIEQEENDTVDQTKTETEGRQEEVPEPEDVEKDATSAANSRQISPRDSGTEEKIEDEVPAGDELEGPGGQATEEEEHHHHQSDVEEAHEPVDEESAASTEKITQNGTNEDRQTAPVEESEVTDLCDAVSLEQPVADEDQPTNSTPTKPEQNEAKTGSSRRNNGRSTTKTAGPVGMVPSQQNEKHAVAAIMSPGRGKHFRQSDDTAAVTRLPPISVSGMTRASDRRKQPGGADSADTKGGEAALTRRRNTDTSTMTRGVGTGRQQYKCSATAYVTVRYQPPAETEEQQSPAANDLHVHQSPATSANRNRKHNTSTSTKLNGDRLPLVMADSKNLTSHASIVGGDSLRIVVDGFRVPTNPRTYSDVTSGGGDDPVSVRIDVAMMTTGGGRRLARRHEGCTPNAYSQTPMLPVAAQRHLMATNRDVISTRAHGPAFCL